MLELGRSVGEPIIAIMECEIKLKLGMAPGVSGLRYGEGARLITMKTQN